LLESEVELMLELARVARIQQSWVEQVGVVLGGLLALGRNRTRHQGEGAKKLI